MDLLGDDGLLDLRKRARRTDPKEVVDEIRGRRSSLPDRNEELAAWLEEDGAPRPDGSGCHVCGRMARLTCKACGRGVCAQDSWFMLGLCRACATEERVQAWHGEEPDVGNWLEQDDGPERHRTGGDGGDAAPERRMAQDDVRDEERRPDDAPAPGHDVRKDAGRRPGP